MNKKQQVINYLINLCFFLYFLILLGERLASIILSFINQVGVFSNAFNGYVYILCFLSIACWLVFLLITCRKNIKALFIMKDIESLRFDMLSIASGILLLSGMVHTEYTTSVVQFISYGLFIIAILLKVILLSQKESINRPLLWMSFVYIVCFSMAIPVMYHSLIEMHVLFHVLEAIASLSMVGIFTYFLLIFFKEEKEDLFNPIFILFSIAIVTPLIALRWSEEINFFVLIFLSASTLMFLVGYIYKTIKVHKS